MKLLKCFVIVVVFSIQNPVDANSRVEIVSKLIKDVIKNERAPSVLWAKTCWSKYDDWHFLKSSSIPVQIIKNSAVIDIASDDMSNKLWFFIDFMDCNAFEMLEFMQNINEKYFALPYRWMLIDPPTDSLNGLTVLPDSNVIIANFSKTQDQFILSQIYKIDKSDFSFIRENFGTWTFNGGVIDLRTVHVISRRRRYLSTKVFRAGMVLVHNDSINHLDLDDVSNSHIDSMSKVTHVITHHLVNAVNASVIIDIVSTWGYKDPKTGSFNGLTGLLERKEADIAASVLLVTFDRGVVVEYLSMTLPTKAAFVFRSPQLSYVSNIYYLPFTGVVWACTTALVALSSTIIYFTFKIRFLSNERNDNYNISDFCIMAVGSICQMGTQLTPKIMSSRISMFFFIVALMFIYTSYTANIVALLQSTAKNINTLDDLQQSSLDVGVEDTPYSRYFFPATNEPSRKRLYQTKINPPNKPPAFMDMSTGISKIRDGFFAYHMELGIGYRKVKDTFLEHEKCGLVEIPYLEIIDPWFAIQKRSPYKEILKVNVFKIREHGIQSRENSRVYTTRPICSSNGQNFDSVRFIDCYAAVLVLCYGFLASMVFLLIEKTVKGKLSIRFG